MCTYIDCTLEDYTRLQRFKLFEKSDCSVLHYSGLLTAFILLFIYLFGCASGLSCFLGTGGEINEIKIISNNGEKTPVSASGQTDIWNIRIFVGPDLPASLLENCVLQEDNCPISTKCQDLSSV